MNENIVCEVCGKDLDPLSSRNGCKSCLVKASVKELLLTAIGPLALVALVLSLASLPATALASQKILPLNFFWALLFVAGIPYGMKKMCTFIVPVGHGISGGFAILMLNFIVGGIIGMFVLAWRVILSVINLVKASIMLIQIARMPA